MKSTLQVLNDAGVVSVRDLTGRVWNYLVVCL